MITLDEALSRIAGALLPVSSEQVGLGDAFGRILAKPLVAERTQPPFSASAMDGYAVRSADLTGQTVRFQVTGESAAGHATSRPVGAGEAFRVSTGAPMPDGADQVVIQENCTREESDRSGAESCRRFPCCQRRPCGPVGHAPAQGRNPVDRRRVG